MEIWAIINSKLKQIIKEKRFVPGALYRAITFDGDIFDGVLVYVSNSRVELHTGDSFRSFYRGCTKLVKLSSLERE